MKLAKMGLMFGLLALSASSAFGAESVHRNVSRKGGGEVLEHRTDPKVYDIDLMLGAQDFKVLVRSMAYITSDGKAHTISIRDALARNPQASSDPNGFFVIPKKTPVTIPIYEKSLLITSVRVQAESFGGAATMIIATVDRATNKPAPRPNPQPQPGPQPRPQPVPQPAPRPTQPPGDQAAERQCSRDLPAATSALRNCNANADTASTRLSRYDDDLRMARERLSRVTGPLDQCKVQLSDVQNRGDRIASDLQRAINDRNDMGNQLANIRIQTQEASNARSGRGYRCSVNGRHQRFSADGASAAKALQSAMAQCGENNCGKGDYSGVWSCVTL